LSKRFSSNYLDIFLIDRWFGVLELGLPYLKFIERELIAERQVTMRRAIAIAAFILFFAIPAHAQKGAAAGGSSTSMQFSGGGGFGGDSGARPLPSYPPAHFKMSNVSGSQASFIPSAFLPFDRAVAVGQAMLDAQKKSAVVAAAAEDAVKPRAKVVVVQDANGNPIIVKQ